MNQTNTSTCIDLDAAQLDKLQAEWETAFDMGKTEYPIDPATVLQLIELARRSTSEGNGTAAAGAVAAIVRDVCELDYSGEEWDHEKMLSVTVEDLRLICARHVNVNTSAAIRGRELAGHLQGLAESLRFERDCPHCQNTFKDAECDAAATTLAALAQQSASQPAATVVAADGLLVDVAALLRPLVSDGKAIRIKDARKVLQQVDAAHRATPPAPTRQPLADERALFEAAWRAKFNMPASAPFSKWEDGSYKAPAINDYYDGWCMGRAALAQQAGAPAGNLQGLADALKFKRGCPKCGHVFEDAECTRAAETLERLATPTPAADAVRTDAARDVLAERRRQVEIEGWTTACDDEHSAGQMARAAACYAAINSKPVPSMWPWAPEWWKPRDDRRNLVKAGALILAEIERIDRAAMSASQAKTQGDA